MMNHAAHGGSLNLCLKDFYASDQFAVMGIGRLAQDGLSIYHEPFSATGASVYPGEYYRILGKTADLTGTSVVWPWNVVGLTVSAMLIGLALLWSVRLAPGTRAWVLAPLPFLVGTLYWWESGTWIYIEGQSVLWPGVATLYSPGGETPAVFMVGIALIVFVGALCGAQDSRSIARAAAAGVATGLTLHIHAIAAVFCAVAVVLMLLWDHLLGDVTARRRVLVGSGILALLLVAAIAPAGGMLMRLAVLVGAIGVALATDATWRHSRGLVAIAWAGAALLASLPLSARLATQALGGEGYFDDRQASVALADTSLPPLAVFWMMLPVWALAATVMVRLVRDGRRTTPGWAALLGGLTSATLLLTLAGNLGAQGLEWHRFLIIGSVLTTMAAGPGLWLVLRDARPRVRLPGWGVAALLAATLPATVAFSQAQRHAILCVTPQDADAWNAIHEAAGDRLLLLDRCLSPGPIRVMSGARVVAYNAGIAIPSERASDRCCTEAPFRPATCRVPRPFNSSVWLDL